MTEQEKPQRFMEKVRTVVGGRIDILKKYLSRNRSLVYKIIFFVSACFYVLVYVSTFFTVKLLNIPSDVISTAKSITPTHQVVLVNRTYNDHTGLLAIQLQLKEQTNSLVTPTLHITNELQDETSHHVNVRVVEIDRTNYMVYVTGLHTWKAQRLVITIPNSATALPLTFISKRDEQLVIDRHLVEKSDRDLLVDTVQLKIKHYEQQLKQLDDKVVQLNKEMDSYHKEILKIDAEKVSQTESEKHIAKQKIDVLYQRIQQNLSVINDVPNQKATIQNEINQLIEQLEHIKK